MPHYKDGTEAKVGDVVKGRGYNIPHEITGKVVQVRAGPSAQGGCTLSVAHVGIGSRLYCPIGEAPHLQPVQAPPGSSPGSFLATPTYKADVDVEYGDTVAFEKIG